MSERQLRTVVADVCHRIYEKGFVASNDGNVSARLDEKTILITPSGVSKGCVTPAMLVVCDMSAKKLRGRLKLSSEVLLHLGVYKARPDVGGVIHSHAPCATALTVAGVSLAGPVLPEVLVALGSIPTTDYATPTSLEGPKVIANLIRHHDAMLLDRHGTLTVGGDPWEAYWRLEKVEHAAHVLVLAHQLGRVRKVSRAQIRRLVGAVARLGITAKIATLNKDIGTEE